VRQQILLPRLPEHKAVDGKARPEIRKALLLFTEGQHGNAPFHAGAAFHGIDPIWFEVVLAGCSFRGCKVKKLGPRVVAVPVHSAKATQTESEGQVLANRVPFVAMNPSFALLQIHWIGGKVSVVHDVAVRVEVEALLADRSGRQDERPEG
jgi:hypothetical protein